MILRRFIAALSIVHLSGRASAATPGVLQIPFTNDRLTFLNGPAAPAAPIVTPTGVSGAPIEAPPRIGQYGPDGPWQAIAISVGNSSSQPRNPYSGVWPVINDATLLLGKAAGGNYTAQSPETKPPVPIKLDSATYFANYSILSDDKMVFPNKTAPFNSTTGQLSVLRLLATSDDETVAFTTEIVEMAGWEVSLPNGAKYTPKTGLLGMKKVLNSLTGNGCTTACTQEHVQNAGLVGSRTFSLHIGSTTTGQQGSFALGGYEQNRVLGPVGVFDVVDDVPIAFLRSVLISQEEGFSPYILGGDSKTYKQEFYFIAAGALNWGNQWSIAFNAKIRAGPGEIVVSPNAASPDIYLPGFFCQNIATYIPVYKDQATGYYLYNTSSPFYRPLINSPAYLAIGVADRTARDITIKVPFKLLHLFLEPPLVPSRVPYFPCRDMDSQTGYWQLGRAFLQAAFFGYSMDQNVSYLAQAPGPDIKLSTVRAWKPDDVGVDSLPLDTWWPSWKYSLTPLYKPLNLKYDGTPYESAGAGPTDWAGFGAMIGGLVAGVAAFVGVWGWVRRYYRRKSVLEKERRLQRKKNGGTAELAEDGTAVALKALEMGDEKICEIGVDVARHEMGNTTTFELETAKDNLVSPLSPTSDEMGSPSAATAMTAETEGAEGTIRTETETVDQTPEDQKPEVPGVYEMPGDQPLNASERDMNIKDGRDGKGPGGAETSPRSNTAGSDSEEARHKSKKGETSYSGT